MKIIKLHVGPGLYELIADGNLGALPNDLAAPEGAALLIIETDGSGEVSGREACCTVTCSVPPVDLVHALEGACGGIVQFELDELRSARPPRPPSTLAL